MSQKELPHDDLIDKLETVEALRALCRVLRDELRNAPEPEESIKTISEEMVEAALAAKIPGLLVTLRQYIIDGGAKYWSPSSYLWPGADSKPNRIVRAALRAARLAQTTTLTDSQCVAIYQAVVRSSLTRDVKSGARMQQIVRNAIEENQQ